MPKVAFRSAKGRLPRDSLSRSESRKTSGRRAPSAILFVAFVAFCSNSFLEQKQTKETKNTFETGNPQDRRALAEGCRLRCRLATNPRLGFPCLADLPLSVFSDPWYPCDPWSTYFILPEQRHRAGNSAENLSWLPSWRCVFSRPKLNHSKLNHESHEYI